MLEDLGVVYYAKGDGFALDGIVLVEAKVGAQESSRRESVFTLVMITKFAWHVRTAKAQREYLRDHVADACLGSNINVNHHDKHYIYICDYAQNMEISSSGDINLKRLTTCLTKGLCNWNGRLGSLLQ